MMTKVAFEEQILQVVKELPLQRIQEVIRYANFLRWEEKKGIEEIIEFDEWALNLAKKRGFLRLTEDDVAKIVHECRKEP